MKAKTTEQRRGLTITKPLSGWTRRAVKFVASKPAKSCCCQTPASSTGHFRRDTSKPIPSQLISHVLKGVSPTIRRKSSCE